MSVKSVKSTIELFNKKTDILVGEKWTDILVGKYIGRYLGIS